MSNTEVRLARLERELQMSRRSSCRDRWVMGGLLCLMVLVMIGGTGQREMTPDELRVKKLSIVDEKGKVRGTMGLENDGAPAIYLFHDKSEAALMLTVSNSGDPGLSLFNGKAKGRALLALEHDGASMLSLADEKGKGRLLLKSLPDGSPGVIFFDDSGKRRMSLAINNDGAPGIFLRDAKENTLWEAPTR